MPGVTLDSGGIMPIILWACPLSRQGGDQLSTHLEELQSVMTFWSIINVHAVIWNDQKTLRLQQCTEFIAVKYTLDINMRTFWKIISMTACFKEFNISITTIKSLIDIIKWQYLKGIGWLCTINFFDKSSGYQIKYHL